MLKRKLDRGQPGDGMTAARATKLTSIGFEWEVGASKQDAVWEGWLAKLDEPVRRRLLAHRHYDGREVTHLLQAVRPPIILAMRPPALGVNPLFLWRLAISCV
jgi:hypothetical protein